MLFASCSVLDVTATAAAHVAAYGYAHRVTYEEKEGIITASSSSSVKSRQQLSKFVELFLQHKCANGLPLLK